MAEHKPLTTEEQGHAAVEAWILEQGYPDMETYRMEEKLVTLGYQWHHHGGDEVLDEFYRVLDDLLQRGWQPRLLDGQQEMWIGKELTLKVYAKFKERDSQSS